jgi:hypothetical protein
VWHTVFAFLEKKCGHFFSFIMKINSLKFRRLNLFQLEIYLELSARIFHTSAY